VMSSASSRFSREESIPRSSVLERVGSPGATVWHLRVRVDGLASSDGSCVTAIVRHDDGSGDVIVLGE
jgi:predicted secreted protein